MKLPLFISRLLTAAAYAVGALAVSAVLSACISSAVQIADAIKGDGVTTPSNTGGGGGGGGGGGLPQVAAYTQPVVYHPAGG